MFLREKLSIPSRSEDTLSLLYKPIMTNVMRDLEEALWSRSIWSHSKADRCGTLLSKLKTLTVCSVMKSVLHKESAKHVQRTVVATPLVLLNLLSHVLEALNAACMEIY
jgi:hypothetical protein